MNTYKNPENKYLEVGVDYISIMGFTDEQIKAGGYSLVYLGGFKFEMKNNQQTLVQESRNQVVSILAYLNGLSAVRHIAEKMADEQIEIENA